MCCCCPAAINALFCLWLQSGCSKGSVAGALTFFPPEPALYKFERQDKSGNVLAEDEEAGTDEMDEDDDEDDGDEDGLMEGRMTPSDADFPDVDLVEVASPRPSGHVEPIENAKRRDKEKSPAQQLTERAAALRKRAKSRYLRDCRDAENGVKYRIVLDPRLATPPTRGGASVESIKLRSKQRSNNSYIATVVYRVPPDQQTPRTKTIIYSHGNATDLGAMFMLQSIMCHALQCNVVVYDYSGYGESGGVPLENASYSDLKTVYEYVNDNLTGGDPSNVVLYGQSVGSGPSCDVAYKNNELGGMILHSPFTSGMRVLTPSRLLACLDIYPNINKIRHVRCPVMVIHGKLDEEVAFHHGVEMFQAVPEDLRREPWWVADRGHNDITEGPGKMSEYLRRLRYFMAHLDDE